MAASKAKSLADVIASAEATVNKNIEPIKAEVAAIEVQLPAILQHVRDAQDRAGATAEIETKWLRGEDVSAMDYVLAQAEDAKAEALSTGLRRKRDSLVKRLPADNTILAEHLRPVFEAVLPGVPVHVTNAPLQSWKQDVPDGTVAVVLVQQPGHTIDPYTSAMSGQVTVYFLRSALHRSMEVNAVETAGRAHKRPLEVKTNLPAEAPQYATYDLPSGTAKVQTQRTPEAQEHVIDTMTVAVSGVVDGLPIIRKVETFSLVPTWITAILGAQDIGRVNYVSGRIQSAREWNGPGSWRAMLGSTDVKVYAANGKELVHEDGTRTVTVTNRVLLTGAEPGHFVALMQEQANKHAGSVHVGVGMLDSATVEWEPPANVHTDTFVIDVTQTFRSQVATDEWTQARKREQQERETVAHVKESHRVAAEDRVERNKKRLHPGVEAAR